MPSDLVRSVPRTVNTGRQAQLREVDQGDHPGPAPRPPLPSRGTTTTIGAVVAALVARWAGVSIPGADYIHRVFADGVVFFFVRMIAIAAIGVIILFFAWLAGSLASHIRHRRWIRRIAGFEPQALHHGAAELEKGYEAARATVDELSEENAELAHALEMTSAELRVALMAIEMRRGA